MSHGFEKEIFSKILSNIMRRVDWSKTVKKKLEYKAGSIYATCI